MMLSFGVELFFCLEPNIMFIPDLKQICLILLLTTSVAFAEDETSMSQQQTDPTVYKWIDPTEVTNYSETQPKSGQAQKLDLPPLPPPATDAEEQLKKLNEQIEQDSSQAKKQQQENEKQLAKENQKQRHCQSLTETLRAYQNNPGRRMYDDDGNAYRLTEVERQETINDLQKYLESECK